MPIPQMMGSLKLFDFHFRCSISFSLCLSLLCFGACSFVIESGVCIVDGVLLWGIIITWKLAYCILLKFVMLRHVIDQAEKSFQPL